MTPKTFVFLGRSGSGKGTQVELLKKRLETSGQSLSLDMGGIYRSFFSHDGYIQEIARDVSMNQGKFQPDFLTNALFVANAIPTLDGTSHVFIDGYPRSSGQLATLKELLAYAKRDNPIFINIEVSAENVKKRMLGRGRGDDTSEKIDSRLAEYQRSVVPLLAEIKNDPSLTYLEIDGEPSIETIAADIAAKLGL